MYIQMIKKNIVHLLTILRSFDITHYTLFLYIFSIPRLYFKLLLVRQLVWLAFHTLPMQSKVTFSLSLSLSVSSQFSRTSCVRINKYYITVINYVKYQRGDYRFSVIVSFSWKRKTSTGKDMHMMKRTNNKPIPDWNLQ